MRIDEIWKPAYIHSTYPSEEFYSGRSGRAHLNKHELLVIIPHFPVAQGTGESISKYPVFVKKLNLLRRYFRECICITGVTGEKRIYREKGFTEIALDFSNYHIYMFRFVMTYLQLILRLRRRFVAVSLSVEPYVFASALLCKIWRSRFVMYLVSPLQFGHGLIRQIRMKLLLYLSDFVITLTPQMAEQAYRIHSRRPILILPNWPDASFRYLGLQRKPNTLLYVGRLSPEKRVDLLLGAMRIVASELADANLFIVGDGPERKRLEGLSISMGIEKKCSFLGWLSMDEVNEYYNTCEVLVFPSPNEYFPNILAESIVARIPIVTIENDSYKWIVGKAGVFCQSNYLSLARGILEVLQDPGKISKMRLACVEADLHMKRILNRQLGKLDALLNQ